MNEIKLSSKAKADLLGIREYIAVDLENESAADAVISKILRDIRRLREYALLGASLSSITNINSEYRYLISGNYMVFYRAYSKEVFVDRILYGRRDYLRVLFGDTEEVSESHRQSKAKRERG